MRILCYGVGKFAEFFLNNIPDNIVITGFVETNKTSDIAFGEYKIYGIDEIEGLDYDKIFITNTYIDTLMNLIEKDIPTEHLVICEHSVFDEYCSRLEKKGEIPYIAFAKSVADKWCEERENCIDPKSVTIKKMNDAKFDFLPKAVNKITIFDDYCRVGSLLLAANEIIERNIYGDIAELGVYRGVFASYISRFFSDRQFLLYDTFEGFSKEELEYEVEHDYWSGSWAKEHNMLQDTSVELVLNKVTNPERCIIRKGLFPDSLEQSDYDRKFAFVSLDVDLYIPTLAGLEFFYPRLSKGGYIMIHDYNGNGMKGVRKAVDDFQDKYGHLAKVAIPDTGGTLVISK